MDLRIRDYRAADEDAWLRCRALAFLRTPSFDDVLPAKPPCPPPGWQLVAVDASAGGAVVGVLDASVDTGAALATIDTIAVHPDRQRRGIGDALLDESLRRAAAAGARTLDAWTRDHPPTLAWYRARFPVEEEDHLQIHAAPDEIAHAVAGQNGLRPALAFLRAPLEREAELRARFARVYVDRRFSRPVEAAPPAPHRPS